MKQLTMLMVVLGMSGLASATYVPATPENTTPVTGTFAAYPGTNDQYDNQWNDGFDWNNNGVTSLVAWGSETVPALATTITGLNASHTYEVSVLFVGFASVDGWGNIQAAISGNPLLYCMNSNSVNTGIMPYTPDISDAFSVFEHSLGSISGTSTLLVDVAQAGNTFYVGLNLVEIPEPTSLALLSVGGLLLRLRRKA